SVAPLAWLIIPALLGAGAYEIATMLATRGRRYAAMSRTTVVQSLMAKAIQLGFGFYDAKPLGLVLGEIVGRSAGVLSLVKQMWETIRLNAGQISLRRIRMAAGLYRSF